MRSSGAGFGCWSWALVAVMAATPIHGALAAGPSGGESARVSVAEYRKHLEDLDGLVAKCQKERSAEACDRAQIGSDDQVQLIVGEDKSERVVRYDWLRDLLDRAGKKGENAAANSGPILVTKTAPASVDTLLTQARQRLNEDWKLASEGGEVGPRYDAERKTLNAILARKEYKGVSESSARERFLEWLSNALDDAVSKLIRFGSRSPWITFALRALLLVSICVGLVWALIRIERKSRIKLAPEPIAVSGAPSAREWQLWLADAHVMAGQGLWREAIHFLYWAAIARLESRRMWPADRARTPREYLRLLPAADPRLKNLTTLTRSFERTWYGGRDAGAADFETAEKLAAELGVE